MPPDHAAVADFTIPGDDETAGVLDRAGTPESRRDYALQHLACAYRDARAATHAALRARLDKLPPGDTRAARARLVAQHGLLIEALRGLRDDRERSIEQTYDLEAGLRDGLAAVTRVPLDDVIVIDFESDEWRTG